MALAAIFGFSTLPKAKAPETSGDQQTASQNPAPVVARAGSRSVPDKLKKSPCWEIEKSILIFIDKDGDDGKGTQQKKAVNAEKLTDNQKTDGTDGNAAAPGSCFADNQPLTPERPIPGDRVRFIVATLPDPVHTHFPQLFDRLTEALQQAAQDQRYNYDSSWLPWAPKQKGLSAAKNSESDDARIAAQQAQPGVLVFRRAFLPKSDDAPYDAGVIVFVVGENPTGGIDPEQLQNALDWVDVLGGAGAKQRAGILGPYFSGSFPSLYEALLRNQIVGMVSAPAQKSASTKEDQSGRASPPQASDKPQQSPVQVQETTEDAGQTPAKTQQPLAGQGQTVANGPGQPPASETSPTANAHGQAAAAGKVDSTPAQRSRSQGTSKTFAIFSGSVTSKAGIDWFNARLAKTSARFFSFQQNDDNIIDNYCRYLRNQGYDTGRLAILSEDETAYGFSQPPPRSTTGAGSKSQQDAGAPESETWLPHCDTPKASPNAIGRLNWIIHREDSQTDKHGPLYVYYPRDIAALRSAYSQQQPAGNSKTPATSATGLPLDLMEPASRERDTISSFGERQTALSQEATLFGLSNLFKAHDIQFIVLRSSNTLDQVFLTRFFSQACPSARIVLTSADLLFRRSSDTAGFRGTMTLTTYPLLTWQQDWTHWQSLQSRHSHRAFPEDTAEGLYLAARFLIGADWGGQGVPDAIDKNEPLKVNDEAIKIQDYAPPSWLIGEGRSEDCSSADSEQGNPNKKMAANTRPPTWLSVVGNGQLWPVAVLGKCINGPPSLHFYPGSIEHVDAKGTPEDTLPWAETGSKAEHSPDFVLPLSMFLCCAIVLGWSVWHFFCCLFGSHLSSIQLGKRKLSPSSFRSLAYFAPVPRRQHRWLIFIGCFLMWVLAVSISAATGVLHNPYALENPVSVTAYCVLLGVLPFLSLNANYRTFLPPKWSRNKLLDPSSRKWQDRLQRALTVRSIWKACRRLRGSKCRKALLSQHNDAQRSLGARPQFDVPLMVIGTCLMAILAFAIFWIFYGWIIASLGPGGADFATWRSMNLFSGVSATLPLLLLTAGLYGWFWYSLSGLALFNAGVPKLPYNEDLPPTMPMFSREGPGKRIQEAATPLKGTFRRHFLFFAAAYSAFWWFAGDATSIRALGPLVFGKVYAVWFGLLIVLTLTESWEMLRTWGELRELLTYLDRMPLRRTLQALGGISWGTVWKMSGNVLEQRYRLVSRQIESLRHLEKELELLQAGSPDRAKTMDSGAPIDWIDYRKIPPLHQRLDECNMSLKAFAEWYAAKYTDCQYGDVKDRSYEADLAPAADFQVKLASAAGVVLTRILMPAWRSETESLILEWPPAEKDKKFAPELPKEDFVKAAEEFFCLPYLGFIQNILGRIRTMTLAIVWLFLGATLSVASYPFDPRPVTSGIFVFVFLVVAAVMIFVYSQMHRDATLSHITNTNPGELGSDFWIKLITFGIGPLVALITALFPDLTGFVTSWLQPAVGSIK